MADERKPQGHATVPLWRNVRFLEIVFQAVVLVVVVGVLAFLANNAITTMDARGFLPNFDFLGNRAGFAIADPIIPYEPRDTYARALTVGLFNTLLVSFAGIIIATLVGLVVGIARLSRNWMVNRLALGYVELFRNTPLLLQLIVIYFAVFLQLPGSKEAISLPGSIYISKSGLDLPRALATDTSWLWLAAIGAAIIVAIALWIVAGRREAQGRPPLRLRPLAIGLIIMVPVLGWFLLAEPPVAFERPELGRFNYEGGLTFSAEFAALTVGLGLYTAAFVAEIIRGAIESVDQGQVEAARAIGLKEAETLRLVILPQALRVIIPPLTSQYLNLIKNSSLALVIGFQDVFGISKTITTQTGQSVSVLVVVMMFYLAISLITSVLMNFYNRRVQIKER